MSSFRPFSKWSRLFLLVVCIACGNAFAQTAASTLVNQITQATQTLVATTGQNPAPGSAQAQTIGALALQRQQLLLQLAAIAPSQVLPLTVPSSLISQLPDAAKPYMESAASAQGSFEIRFEDSQQTSRVLYFVKSQVTATQLYFTAKAPTLATGTSISVNGTKIGAAIVVDSASGVTTGGQTSLALPSPTLPNTFGAQATAVILVNFQDNSSQPYTVATARNIVFTQANAFIKENSQNQTSLTGDVFGWFNLPTNSTTCDTTQIQTLADQAAAASGVVLSNYTRILYAFPTITACGWEATGSIGGSPSRGFINGTLTLLTAAHQLGHGFGLYDSHALSCPGTTLGTSCTTQPYGDLFDAMGNTGSFHYNAFQKERLGWLGFGTSLPMTTVTSTGQYSVTPYETASGTKALKIVGNSANYYVEYRQAVGQDESLYIFPTASKGLLIHKANSSDGNSSLLLDMNPATSWFNDAVLLPGEKLTDTAAGVTIEAISADGSTGVVKVTVVPVSCTAANPTVTLVPVQSASVPPGTTFQYTASVTDNDSSACGAVTYNLSASVLAGWTGVLGNASLTLNPGVTTATTLNVTSPITAADGLYNVGVTATNSAANSFTGFATSSYVVAAAPNNPGPTDFSLNSSAPSVSIVQGGTGSLTLTTTISGQFSSQIGFLAFGAPPGVLAVLTPNSIPVPGSGNLSYGFSVGSTVPLGTYVINIAASGGGITHSIQISLNVTSNTPPPPPPVQATLIPQTNFHVLFADSTETNCGNYPASNAIDGSSNSFWQTQYCFASPNGPHEYQIDMGGSYNVAGFTYLPRQDGIVRGKVKQYEFYVSTDGQNWGSPVSTGSLITTSSDVSLKQVVLSQSYIARYVRLRGVSEVNGGPWMSMAEFNVFQLATTTCVNVRPQVSIAPLQSVGSPAGSAVDFTITVANKDSSPCTAATFNLTALAPQGWSASVADPSLTIAPGAIGTTTLHVTSSPGATNGFYGVQVTAANAADLTLSGSATATYTVSNPSTGDFTVSSSSSTVTLAQGAGGSATITTTISGGFNAAVSLTVSGMPSGVTAVFGPDSIAAPGVGTSTLQLTVGAAVPANSYNLTVVAAGGGITKSVPITLTVTGTVVVTGPPGPIPQAGWTLKFVDSQETFCGNYAGTMAFDGNPSTLWQTGYCLSSPSTPHEIQIDLGATYNVSGFKYLARQDLLSRGKIKGYEFYVSTDGTNWGTAVATGNLITDPNDAAEKTVMFTTAKTGRFVRLRAMSEVNGGPWTSVAEINVLKQ